MGSSLAARLAGYTPKNTPTLPETNNATDTAQTVTDEGIPISERDPLSDQRCQTTPNAPPIKASITASIKNCSRTS